MTIRTNLEAATALHEARHPGATLETLPAYLRNATLASCAACGATTQEARRWDEFALTVVGQTGHRC